ncbi:MAG: putative cell surface glycoprotein [Anaerolineaceae bacterium]|nr:MAG: putative cell surface glycoprotein [Anaerolineaceae bacterium]
MKQRLMSKIFAMALVAVLVLIPTGLALAATQTIGGTAVAGNLRVAVYDNGAMAIQQYTGAFWQENVYGVSAKGSTLCVATTRYDMGGNSTWTPGAGGTVATWVSNASSGPGTWTIVTTWTAGGMTIVQTTSYTDGNQYYTINWAVTNNSGVAINDLRLFNGQDTLLGGSDSGNGWWNAGLGAFGSIGVTHPTTGQQMWLQPVSEAPFQYESRVYYTSRVNVDACALDGTVTAAVHDNGYALEFRRAALANGATWSVTLEEHFTPAAPPAPTLTGITPNSGPTAGGTVVTITGTNLAGGAFTFGGTPAVCTVAPGGLTATCTTPPHAAGLFDVVVTTPGGTATLTNAFTFIPPVAPALPATGFAPDRVTALPEQSVAYAASDLRLEIPRLGVSMDIVGVPQSGNTWDVSWLGKNAGWLQGTAFPTWNGNSVLTGHVWNADNSAGPFVYLNTLWYGDRIIVHAWGQQYTYEVRSVTQVRPDSTSAAFAHKDTPWLTLTTCRSWDADKGTYRYRVIVQAALVSVK